MSLASPWSRMGFTVLLLFSLGLGLVPIPGVDPSALGLGGAPGLPGLRSLFNLVPPQRSILSLGLVPFIAAAQLVELVALAVPRLRPLRVGGPAARARLHQAALLVTLLLAMVQAYFIAVWIESAAMSYNGLGVLVEEPGLGFRLVAMATMVAGVASLVLVGHLISARGLGNGFSLLIATGLALSLLDSAMAHVHWVRNLGEPVRSGERSTPVGVRIGDFAPLHGAAWVGAMAALAYAVIRLSRHATWVVPAEVTGFGVQLPTCGLLPLVGSASLLMLPEQLAAYGLSVGPLGRLIPGSESYLVAQLLLVAGLGYLLSMLFHRPRVVTHFAARFDTPPAADRVFGVIRRGTLVSITFLCVVVLASHFLASHGVLVDPLTVMLLALIGLDVRREWSSAGSRDRGPRVSIWELHRLYAVRGVEQALRRAGVEPFFRGLQHRSALHFFGPYIPVEVLVAPADVDRAHNALALLLDPSAGADYQSVVVDGDGEAREEGQPQ